MDIFLGRFHPLVVHLPIGFLILAFIFKVISSRYPQRYSELNKAISITLILGAASAIMACILGHFLSLDGGYDSSTVFWHKWTGNLTHGSDYLLAYAPAPLQKIAGYNSEDQKDIDIPSDSDSIIVFEHIINPIMKAKCFSCHNSSKAKGGLDLTSKAGILAGGDEGAFIVAGSVYESGFFNRVTLSQKSKKFMPLSGAPLTYNEIQILEWWIQEGASMDGSIMENEIPDPIQKLLLKEFKIDARLKSFYDKVALAPIDDKILNNLQSLGFSVSKLSVQHEFLDVKIPENALTSEKISYLSKAKEHITWLDLSDQTIEDASFNGLSELQSLTRLELNNTSLTDRGIEYLVGLSNLESLNLYGTDVSDASIDILGGFKTLKRLYVWDTKITDEGAQRLQETLPELEIIF